MQVLLVSILIYYNNESEHKEHLQMVFSCLRKHSLYSKLSKFSFYQNEIHYLGHIISSEGISVNLENVKAIMDWLVQRNAHKVSRFMSLEGYYKGFVERF